MGSLTVHAIAKSKIKGPCMLRQDHVMAQIWKEY